MGIDGTDPDEMSMEETLAKRAPKTPDLAAPELPKDPWATDRQFQAVTQAELNALTSVEGRRVQLPLAKMPTVGQPVLIRNFEGRSAGTATNVEDVYDDSRVYRITTELGSFEGQL